MRIPIGRLADALKMGVSTLRDSDEPVRVAVFVDRTASPDIVAAVRDALVPQTTSALVRVSALDSTAPEVKPDTDVALVLSCGSDLLEDAVRGIVVAGAPTVVLAESSVEVPFIERDTPMLGLIASTDRTGLLESLARWILDRTEKATAFAANFGFMRTAAANRVVTSCALTNLATGALVFIPGADYPVMTAAQLGMMLELASIYGKPLHVERAYEAAGVAAAGLVLRGAARVLAPRSGRLGFAVKALVAAGGTAAMGRVLMEVYERDVDYSRVNAAVGTAASAVRRAAAGLAGARAAEAAR